MGVARQRVGGDAFPRHFVDAALVGGIRQPRHIRHKGIEKPAPRRIGFAPLEFRPDRPQLLAQLDAEPDGVVPQHFAGAALHHLRADIERGEQRIERRGRGVLQEAFVEAAMLDPAPLAANVAVFDVDLRGLRKARQLLVGRLRGDDARRVGVEIGQPHGEAAGIDRMKLHEAGPGFVEQNVIAERTDLFEDMLCAVDGTVVGALLDDGGAKRPLTLPGVLVR